MFMNYVKFGGGEEEVSASVTEPILVKKKPILLKKVRTIFL